MAVGYTRVHSGDITNGAVIEAAHFNDEYDLIEDAMNSTTGHNHDGTAGGGAPINISTSTTGTLPVNRGGTNAITAADARTSLGVAIGSNVQAWDANLDQIAALAPTDNNFIVGNGSAWALETAASARTSLGLGDIATQASNSVTITGGSISGITDLAVADGGTGSSTASGARTNLGLIIGTDVQAFDATLGGLASLTTAADQTIYSTGVNTFAMTSLTSFIRTLLDDVDLATAQATLGISGGSSQPLDATLTALAGLTTAADRLPYFTGVDTAAVTTFSSFARTYLDDADASTTRGTLGCGTIATQNSSSVSISGGTITGITDLAIADGGTGASSAGAALTALGAAAIGANTFTASQTVRYSGTGTYLSLESTDTGATAGPGLELYRDSSSPATNDDGGTIVFTGRDSAANKMTYAEIVMRERVVTNTSERADLRILTTQGGTSTLRATISEGVVLGTATGGDKGVGTINATAIYDDNVQLTAHAAASQAEMEAGTSTTDSPYVTPGRAHFHPGMAKAWCIFNGNTAGTNAPIAGYNVTDITKAATGRYAINLSITFSNADNYVCIGQSQSASTLEDTTGTRTTTSFPLRNQNSAGTAADDPRIYVVFYGDI